MGVDNGSQVDLSSIYLLLQNRCNPTIYIQLRVLLKASSFGHTRRDLRGR